MTRAWVAGAVAAAIAPAGCGGGSTQPAPPPAARTPGASVQGRPLTRAQVPRDCRSSVPLTTKTAPQGLLNPPAPVAVSRISGDTISGFVNRTPGQFLAAWKARRGLTVDGEDEGREGEVYVTSGARKVSWKLLRACRTGSTFTAQIGGGE